MIAFEISQNGKVLAVAGARDLLGLNAILMGHGDLNGVPDAVRILHMSAIGMANGSAENTALHHTWNMSPEKGEFQVGDTVTIRIVETEEATPPTSSEEIEMEDAEQDN